MTAGNAHDAVILSAGGANGAYEVGVLKALFEGESPATDYVPLDPGVFAGSSIGAYNAALMVSQLDGEDPAIEYVEHVWRDLIPSDGTDRNRVFRYRLNPLDLFGGYALVDAPRRVRDAGTDVRFLFDQAVRRGIDLLASGGDIEERVLQVVDFSAFITREPGDRLVRDTIDAPQIRASRRALKIVATNWRTGAVRVFDNADMTDEHAADIVLASGAIPGVFPPVAFDGDAYVDGGLAMSTPLMPAIDAGADTLHVVYLDPDVGRMPVQRLQSALDAIERIFTIEMALKTNEDLATARWINDGLAVIERVRRGEPIGDGDVRAFVRTAAVIDERLRAGTPYRVLTIHRYHPRDDIGGALGMLRFDRDRIARLIERGYHDALAHDCAKAGCVLPAGR